MESFKLTRETFNDFLFLMRRKMRKNNEVIEQTLIDAGWSFARAGAMVTCNVPKNPRRYDKTHKNAVAFLKATQVTSTKRRKPGAEAQKYTPGQKTATPPVQGVLPNVVVTPAPAPVNVLPPPAAEVPPVVEAQPPEEPADPRMLDEGLVRIVDGWQFMPVRANEFRISATELAHQFGYVKRQSIIDLIERNRVELERYAEIYVRPIASLTSMPQGGTRKNKVDEYYLTEDQARIVAMHADTPRAEEIRYKMIVAFHVLQALLQKEQHHNEIVRATVEALQVVIEDKFSVFADKLAKVDELEQRLTFKEMGGMYVVPPPGFITLDEMTRRMVRNFNGWVQGKTLGQCYMKRDNTPSDLPYNCPSKAHIRHMLKMGVNVYFDFITKQGGTELIKESAEPLLNELFNLWLIDGYSFEVKASGTDHMTTGGVRRNDVYVIHPVKWTNRLARVGYSQSEANHMRLALMAKFKFVIENFKKVYDATTPATAN